MHRQVDRLAPSALGPVRMKRLLLFLLVLAALKGMVPIAWAASPAPPAAPAPAPLAAPALTTSEAKQALEVLNNPAKRAQVADTLEAIIRAENGPSAAPAAAVPRPAAAGGAPANPAAATPATTLTSAQTPAADEKPKVTLNPDSLGAAVVTGVSGSLQQVLARAALATHSVRSLPLLWGWMVVMATNPLAHALLQAAVWRVAVAMSCGLLAEWMIRYLLGRPVRALERAPEAASVPEREAEDQDEAQDEAETSDETMPPHPRRRIAAAILLRRLPLVFVRFLLDLLPVIGFAVAGHIVAASGLGGSDQTRLIIVAMVDAYAITVGVMAFARMLLSPERHRLRLLHVSDATAAWATRWIRRLTVVAVFGYAIAEVGLALGMSQPAHDGLLKIAGWINHVFLAVMVIQKRRAVRNWLRAPAGETGSVARLRNALAPVWHWIALFFIAAIWIAWAVEIPNGYTKILRFFLTIVLVMVLARLALIVVLGTLERMGRVNPEIAGRYPGLESRLAFYHPLVQGTARAIVYIATGVALLELWGVPLFGWFAASLLGRKLAAGIGTLAVTFIVAVLVWEAVNAAVQAHLARLTREQQVARSARLRTLLPLLRTALLVAIVVIAGLTVLSQIGIDIGPLLAGAGIIGVAIGFGSQKLVQDLITGIFLLLENAMQVGDLVTVSGLSGTVENLSVRTIRLRASDGSVHIIPFSAVTSVTNTNRGLGNAAVSVAVSYHEDTDHVGDVLKDIAAEMRKEPDFASKMLSDLQLWGVDKIDGASATLLGQIVCTDAGRWPVQREFNRRVKRRFQELGIGIYNPAQTVVVPLAPGVPTRPALSEPHPAAAK